MKDIAQANPTPKQQLVADKKRVSGHFSILDNPQLLDSINTSLLEQQRILSERSGDANAAAAAQYMQKGALHFVEVFLKLAFVPERSQEKSPSQLNHQA